MIFGWFLNDVITSNPGTVKFSVRFFSTAKEYDASGAEVLKLNFSLSTKTQTITVNPAISYDINEENGLPEVNAYNDLHLVVSRFKDSVYVGEADKAEEPVFTNLNGGIYYDDSQRVKYIETEDAHGKAIRIHVVDLDGNGLLTLSTEATSTDAGKISYFWYEKELAENSLAEKLTSIPTYIETTDFAIDGTKTYYVKHEANGVITYTEATGLVDGELFQNDVKYYEMFNGIEVNSTGNYWVEAKNRHGVASATITSETIMVPGPEALHVIVPNREGNFLNSEGSIILTAIGTTEQKNDNIHYEWNNLTTQEHLASYKKINLGYGAGGNTNNTGSKWEVKGVAAAEFPYFDQVIEVTSWAERNKDVTEEQKFEIRVTADPCAPSVAPINQYPEAKLTNDVEIGVSVSLKKGEDERNIVSDEIKYQWFKYTSDEADNDFLIEGATEAKYIVPGGTNADSGKFYCRVTNVVNGKSISINSGDIWVLRS